MRDTAAPASTIRLKAATHPMRSRKDPLPSEIALLQSLADGPAIMTAGPLGSCTKRGWCRAILLKSSGSGRPDWTVLFELTDVGRSLIAGYRRHDIERVTLRENGKLSD